MLLVRVSCLPHALRCALHKHLHLDPFRGTVNTACLKRGSGVPEIMHFAFGLCVEKTSVHKAKKRGRVIWLPVRDDCQINDRIINVIIRLRQAAKVWLIEEKNTEGNSN